MKFSLLSLLFGLALDYRGGGETGPSVAQYLFLVFSVLGGLGVVGSALVIGRGRIITGSRFGSRMLMIILAFCAWAPVAVIINHGTPHDDFLSVILPYLLYGLSVLAVLLALQNGYDERRLIRLMIVVAAASCGWRFLYAITLGGVDLASARWQILSPALPLILGASVAALTTRTQRPLAAFGMIYFLGIVTLSITRGYLVGLAGVLLATVVTARGRRSALLAPRALGRMAMVLIMVSVSITILALVLPPEVSERWTGRLSGEKSDSGDEITLLYRLAQFKGQYDALTQSTATTLTGRGFGASFIFDEGLLSSLAFVLPDEAIERTDGSDSTWGYPIFAHGVVMGPLFLGAFLAAVLRATRNARDNDVSGSTAFPIAFTCFSLVALLGISLTGNIFGERLGGVLIGALVALCIRQSAADYRYSANHRLAVNHAKSGVATPSQALVVP